MGGVVPRGHDDPRCDIGRGANPLDGRRRSKTKQRLDEGDVVDERPCANGPSGADGPEIYTVGHSNHPLERVVELLRRHEIEVLADVRSQPYSQYAPHFDRPSIEPALKAAGLRYIYLGKELGGRPRGAEFYDPDDGRVLYGRVADTPLFLDGIRRLEIGIQRYRVAIMCSEECPEGCHRRLLVARVLVARGVAVRHIRADGRLEDETEWRDDARATREVQLSLFPTEPRAGDTEWKSIRSVLRKEQRPPSSGR